MEYDEKDDQRFDKLLELAKQSVSLPDDLQDQVIHEIEDQIATGHVRVRR